MDRSQNSMFCKQYEFKPFSRIFVTSLSKVATPTAENGTEIDNDLCHKQYAKITFAASNAGGRNPMTGRRQRDWGKRALDASTP
jgi:hypothetical protein